MLLKLLQEGGINLHGLGEDVAAWAGLYASQLHALRQGACQVKLDALHQVLQDLSTHTVSRSINTVTSCIPQGKMPSGEAGFLLSTVSARSVNTNNKVNKHSDKLYTPS